MTRHVTTVVLILAAFLAVALVLLTPRSAAADRDGERLLGAVAAGLLAWELLDDDGYRPYYYNYGPPVYVQPYGYGYYPGPGYYDYRRGPWRYDYGYRPWSWGNMDRYRYGYEPPPRLHYAPRPYGRDDDHRRHDEHRGRRR